MGEISSLFTSSSSRLLQLLIVLAMLSFCSCDSVPKNRDQLRGMLSQDKQTSLAPKRGLKSMKPFAKLKIKQPKIDIYVAKNCSRCDALERYLSEQGFRYTKHNTDDPKYIQKRKRKNLKNHRQSSKRLSQSKVAAEAAAEKGLPVSLIGSHVIRGFWPDAINRRIHKEMGLVAAAPTRF